MKKKTVTPPGALLNEAEAAAFLCLSPYTLRKWRSRGKGPAYVRVGERSVRYRLTALERFVK